MTDVPVFLLKDAVLPMSNASPFNLKIEKGQCWFFVGENRGGISTLFKVLLGLIHLKRGALEVDGCDVEHTPYRDLVSLRKRCGVVMESDGLVESWSAYDNVSLPLRYHFGMTDSEIENELISVIARLELSFDVFNARVANLSPLERRITSIIRALLIHPRVMVFDSTEPAFSQDGELDKCLIKLISRRVDTILVKAAPSSWHLWESKKKMVAVLRNGSMAYGGPLDGLPDGLIDPIQMQNAAFAKNAHGVIYG